MPSAEEQTRRNTEIALGRATGRTIRDLAEEHGMSQSRVKEVLAKESEAGVYTVPTTAVIQAADARRDEYAAATAEARRLALALPDTQASAKVGAIRLWLDALDRLTCLDQALGHLPRDLHQVGDDRMLLEVIASVLLEHDVPDAARRDLIDRLGGEQCAA